MGQIISYTSGFPVLVVTAYGALTIVYKSGIKWDVASGLLYLSMFGWAAGVIPAVIDGVISVNKVMHNTMWVPGHFHTYLILGLVAMIFGFMYYYTKSENELQVPKLDGLAYWSFLVGGIGFVFMFLVSGSKSVPRRWAVHYEEWISLSQIASIFGAFIVLATFIFLLSFLFRLGNAKYQ